MRVTILQPAMPSYRLDFFARLARKYGKSFSVYYSDKKMDGLTPSRTLEDWERPMGELVSVVRGLDWQPGSLSLPISKGDVLVVCGAPRNLSTLLLLMKARWLGAQTVWWGHYWSATSSRKLLGIRVRLMRLASALLFYTDREVERFKADGWRHPGPISALNNGINTDEISLLRKEYAKSERGNEFLFIGRLTQKARLSLLLQALALMQTKGVKVHIIGSGEEEDNLRALAASLGVETQLRWHGSLIDENAIARVANRCAAFVYPGQVGLSLIHAMGYGLPAIVHDQPMEHMPEIAAFRDGETGLTFKVGSEVSLARQLSRIMLDFNTRKVMASNAVATVENGFSTSRMADRFEELIDSL